MTTEFEKRAEEIAPFKIDFLRTMEMNYGARVDVLWPSAEDMEEECGPEWSDAWRFGFQHACRWLRRRLLGEGKCEKPVTDAADRAELSGEFGVEGK